MKLYFSNTGNVGIIHVGETVDVILSCIIEARAWKTFHFWMVIFDHAILI